VHQVTTQEIAYDADGTTYVGHLAIPDVSGPVPAVLFAHDGLGLSDHFRQRADRIAGQGYTVFALDCFGGGERFTDPKLATAELTRLRSQPDRTFALARAGLDILLAQPTVDHNRLAGLGYSFGGGLVLDLARQGVNLKAVAAYYPSLAPLREAASPGLTTKILVIVGADDPYVTAEQIDGFFREMRDAGADWQLLVLGGTPHGFMHPRTDSAEPVIPYTGYHERSDIRSTAMVLGLFSEV
jgi:dienelactone hydrolase